MNFYDDTRPSFQIYVREHPAARELLADNEGPYAWGYEMGRADAKASLSAPENVPSGYEEGYADGYADFS